MTVAKRNTTILVCLAVAALFIVVANWGGSKPSWKSDLYEIRRVDAQSRVETSVTPSPYAIESLPAEMASGEWTSGQNFMDCINPAETKCFEVDFESPSGNVKCKWLVSYDLTTADFLNIKSLNEAATNLFTRITPDGSGQPEGAAAKPFFDDHDGSPTSDAISLIRNDYSPRDPNTYSIAPQWLAKMKNTLSNDDDVIAVELLQSKADPVCEWIVEIKPGDHDHYKLIRINDAASVTFMAKSSMN